MPILLLIQAVAAQVVPIGSGLADGVRLVYESGGVAQAPWAYDSVRVVPRDDFERCVLVARVGQPPRETCVRADTLFQRDDAGAHVPVRPIGAGMRFDIRAADGSVLEYETGAVAAISLPDGTRIDGVATTITTRAADGTVVRRLREEYAPSLLTALRGEFEEPDGAGGWTVVRAFRLVEVRHR